VPQVSAVLQLGPILALGAADLVDGIVDQLTEPCTMISTPTTFMRATGNARRTAWSNGWLNWAIPWR
jgi:hypothetical protein